MKTLVNKLLLFAIVVLLSENVASKTEAHSSSQLGDSKASKLIEFEAYRVNDRAELHWKSTGQTFDKYIVERSLDRESWVEILHIKGYEGSYENLEHVEIDNTAPSTKLFYRIKRLDVNGIPSYSSVVLIPAVYDFGFQNEITSIQTFDNALDVGSEIKFVDHLSNQPVILLVFRNAAGDEYFAKVKYNQASSNYAVIDTSAPMPEGNYIITATSQMEIYGGTMMIGH